MRKGLVYCFLGLTCLLSKVNAANDLATVINYGFISIDASNPILEIPADTTVNVYDSGWTSVSAGNLIVNGTLRGMTTYLTGGTLSGTGTVDMWGGTFNVSGTVMPGSGNAIGQLNILGDYTQGQQGNLLISINSTSASLLSVSGTAQISGSLSGRTLGGFVPAVGTQYLILTAGTVSGQFTGPDAFISPLLFLKPTYSANDVNVTVTRNYFNPNLTSHLSRNELTILSKLNQFAQSPPNSDMSSVIAAFDILPNNQSVIRALDSLEPIGNDVLLNMAVTSMSLSNLMLNQQYIPFATLPGLSLIAAGNFYSGSQADLLEDNPYNFHGFNAVLGLNYAYNPALSIGALFMANQSYANLTTGSNIRDRNIMLSPYVIYQQNAWYADALLGLGFHSYDMNRDITIGTLNRSASSNPNAYEWLGYFGGGYNFDTASNWQMGPDLAFQFVNLNVDKYIESGAQSLDLSVDSQSLNSLRSVLGAHIYKQIHFTDWELEPGINLSYVHEFANNNHGMTFSWINADNGVTVLTNQNPQRNFGLVNVGVQFKGQKPWKIMLNYSGLIGSHSTNAISALGIWQIA